MILFGPVVESVVGESESVVSKHCVRICSGWLSSCVPIVLARSPASKWRGQREADPQGQNAANQRPHESKLLRSDFITLHTNQSQVSKRFRCPLGGASRRRVVSLLQPSAECTENSMKRSAPAAEYFTRSKSLQRIYKICDDGYIQI